MPERPYDKVTQASLNSIYLKAQELDRNHNEKDAPTASAPGAVAGVDALTSASASDAQTSASPAKPDALTSASARGEDASADAGSHASDAQTHVSDGR